MPRRWIVTVAGGFLAAALGACGGDDFQRLGGETMGTYYAVTMRCPERVALADVEAILGAVNAAMSTYLPDSEVSKFNASRSSEWFAVSRPLAEVVEAAQVLARESGGAFDATVGALVNLWGFGPERHEAFPEPAAVAAARAAVGYRHLDVRLAPPALRKAVPALQLDLSAIAKGFGVDEVARGLVAAGCSDYLVDIGGEVVARGRNPRGMAWQVGIEVPDGGAGIQRVIALDEAAIATSGDYRNFIERDGIRVAHTFDPRTGRPATHALASVSVIMPDAMRADGYATLLHVLGFEDGYAFAESHGLAALFLIRSPARAEGAPAFEERYTPGFSSHLAVPPQ